MSRDVGIHFEYTTWKFCFSVIRMKACKWNHWFEEILQKDITENNFGHWLFLLQIFNKYRVLVSNNSVLSKTFIVFKYYFLLLTRTLMAFQDGAPRFRNSFIACTHGRRGKWFMSRRNYKQILKFAEEDLFYVTVCWSVKFLIRNSILFILSALTHALYGLCHQIHSIPKRSKFRASRERVHYFACMEYFSGLLYTFFSSLRAIFSAAIVQDCRLFSPDMLALRIGLCNESSLSSK